jgi:hypothetical protein
LRSRFDFTSRSWGLPAFENPREAALAFAYFSRQIQTGLSHSKRFPTPPGEAFVKPSLLPAGPDPAASGLGKTTTKPKP